MDKITLDTCVERRDGHFIVSELGDELIMMNLENGSYINLNETGRVIWENILSPVSVRELVKNLMERFEVDEAICTAETISLLTELKREKALCVK